MSNYIFVNGYPVEVPEGYDSIKSDIRLKETLTKLNNGYPVMELGKNDDLFSSND